MTSDKFLTIMVTKDLFINIMKENNQKYFQNFLTLLKYLIETEFSGNRVENLIHSSDVYETIVSSFFSASRSISISVFCSTLLVSICHFLLHTITSTRRLIHYFYRCLIFWLNTVFLG